MKVFPGSGVFFVAYESTLRLLNHKEKDWIVYNRWSSKYC